MMNKTLAELLLVVLVVVVFGAVIIVLTIQPQLTPDVDDREEMYICSEYIYEADVCTAGPWGIAIGEYPYEGTVVDCKQFCDCVQAAPTEECLEILQLPQLQYEYSNPLDEECQEFIICYVTRVLQPDGITEIEEENTCKDRDLLLWRTDHETVSLRKEIYNNENGNRTIKEIWYYCPNWERIFYD